MNAESNVVGKFCCIDFDFSSQMATVEYFDDPAGNLLKTEKIKAAYPKLVWDPLKGAGWQVLLNASFGEYASYYFEYDPTPNNICVLAWMYKHATVSYPGSDTPQKDSYLKNEQTDIENLEKQLESDGWKLDSCTHHPVTTTWTLHICRYKR